MDTTNMLRISVTRSDLPNCLFKSTYSTTTDQGGRRTCLIPSTPWPEMMKLLMAMMFPPTPTPNGSGGGSTKQQPKQQQHHRFQFIPVDHYSMRNRTDYDSEIGAVACNRTQFTMPYMRYDEARLNRTGVWLGPTGLPYLRLLYRKDLFAKVPVMSFDQLYPVQIILPLFLVVAVRIGLIRIGTVQGCHHLMRRRLVLLYLLQQILLSAFRSNVVKFYNLPVTGFFRIGSLERLVEMLENREIRLMIVSTQTERILFSEPDNPNDVTMYRLFRTKTVNPPQVLSIPQAKASLSRRTDVSALVISEASLTTIFASLCHCEFNMLTLHQFGQQPTGAYSSLPLRNRLDFSHLEFLSQASRFLDTRMKRIENCNCDRLFRDAEHRRQAGKRLNVEQMSGIWITFALCLLAAALGLFMEKIQFISSSTAGGNGFYSSFSMIHRH